MQIITKKTIKFVKSLHFKKYRNQYRYFLVEGEKNIDALLTSEYKVKMLISTPHFLEKNQQNINRKDIKIYETSPSMINQISHLSHNEIALAVAEMHEDTMLEYEADEFILALDNVRDPGNLGAILRVADWYGIQKICCSPGTVDFYNPKVIQSSMGSFTRVQCFYSELEDFLASKPAKIYGAFLKGTPLHKATFEKGGIILLGNEANGIDDKLFSFIDEKITIPRIGQVESLNVAVAAGIICDRVFNN